MPATETVALENNCTGDSPLKKQLLRVFFSFIRSILGLALSGVSLNSSLEAPLRSRCDYDAKHKTNWTHIACEM